MSVISDVITAQCKQAKTKNKVTYLRLKIDHFHLEIFDIRFWTIFTLNDCPWVVSSECCKHFSNLQKHQLQTSFPYVICENLSSHLNNVCKKSSFLKSTLHPGSGVVWGKLTKVFSISLRKGATVRWSIIKTWLAPVGPMPARQYSLRCKLLSWLVVKFSYNCKTLKL